jgi:roadblock/LC7 domain-containing protein
LKGVFLPSFLKLIEIERNTCLMEVSTPSGEHGLLYFHEGNLYDALFKNKKGEDAVYAVLALEDVKISFRNLPDKRFKKKIKNNLTTILKKRLQKKGALRKGGKEEIVSLRSSPKKLQLADMQKVLKKIKGIDGFMAAGAFSPNGEMVAEINPSGLKFKELGAIANDVLLKAQKATELMHVGHGQVVHVEAPKAHIICRCLNEAADYAVTASGRAHVHMVLVLNKEAGNVALGKMKLESIIYDVAAYFK